MRHARPDYNRIQDPTGKIPADEPVFLIRGQDLAGPTAVRAWAAEAERNGAALDIVSAAFTQARNMETWQRNRSRKVPDLSEEHNYDAVLKRGPAEGKTK